MYTKDTDYIERQYRRQLLRGEIDMQQFDKLMEELHDPEHYNALEVD